MQQPYMTISHIRMKKCRFTYGVKSCILYTVILHMLLFLSILKSLFDGCVDTRAAITPFLLAATLHWVEKLQKRNRMAQASGFFAAVFRIRRGKWCFSTKNGGKFVQTHYFAFCILQKAKYTL